MTSPETPQDQQDQALPPPPKDIPWTLVSASEDMLDTTFCRGGFPEPWTSSLAISVFEPPMETLPDELCDQRIAYLKISSSITGFVPGLEDIPDDYPWEDAVGLLGDYLACYGVLLSVALFPRTGFLGREIQDLQRLPRIVDFEPKTRDLYQVATEGGEVLTGSMSKASTTNSYVNTESTETGFKLTAAVEVPISEKVKGTLGGEMSRKRTETDQDTYSVVADASRERKEKFTTSTQLNQMYNLLTGYHLGTNRAVFLMLPRPHVLQPTDRRTFIDGLRVIEGVQEFMLISVRPPDMEHLLVEVQLDTGHFPEEVDVEYPEAKYAESHEDFVVGVRAAGSRIWRNECENIHEDPSATHMVGEGWVIDRRSNREDGQTADQNHPGMIELSDSSNSSAMDSLTGYNYRAVNDTTAGVFGRICGKKWGGGGDAVFERSYRVLTRSQTPVGDPGEAIVTTPFLMRSRRLCAGVDFSGACPQPAPLPPEIRPDFGEGIVDELRLSLRTGSNPDRDPTTRSGATKELLKKLQHAMASSPSSVTRTAIGQRDLLDTAYGAKKAVAAMSEEARARWAESSPRDTGGTPLRVSKVQLAEMPLTELMRESQAGATEALRLRRSILGFPEGSSEE